MMHVAFYCIFSLAGRFGQTTPPLVDFLKDILGRYPEGGQILKVRVHAFLCKYKNQYFNYAGC